MPFNYTTAMRLLKTDTPGPPFHITFVIPFNTLNIYIRSSCCYKYSNFDNRRFTIFLNSPMYAIYKFIFTYTIYLVQDRYNIQYVQYTPSAMCN